MSQLRYVILYEEVGLSSFTSCTPRELSLSASGPADLVIYLGNEINVSFITKNWRKNNWVFERKKQRESDNLRLSQPLGHCWEPLSPPEAWEFAARCSCPSFCRISEFPWRGVGNPWYPLQQFHCIPNTTSFHLPGLWTLNASAAIWTSSVPFNT